MCPYSLVCWEALSLSGHHSIVLFFFNWRLITLPHCSGFRHKLTWISHGCTWVPILNPHPSSHPTPSRRSGPGHQLRALSCTELGLVNYFTYGNIHVSMLFSQIIPPSPSVTESRVCSLYYSTVLNSFNLLIVKSKLVWSINYLVTQFYQVLNSWNLLFKLANLGFFGNKYKMLVKQAIKCKSWDYKSRNALDIYFNGATTTNSKNCYYSNCLWIWVVQLIYILYNMLHSFIHSLIPNSYCLYADLCKRAGRNVMERSKMSHFL